MSEPGIRAKLEALGVVLPLGSPEDFRKHIADETQRWGDIIKRAGIKLDRVQESAGVSGVRARPSSSPPFLPCSAVRRCGAGS